MRAQPLERVGRRQPGPQDRGPCPTAGARTRARSRRRGRRRPRARRSRPRSPPARRRRRRSPRSRGAAAGALSGRRRAHAATPGDEPCRSGARARRAREDAIAIAPSDACRRMSMVAALTRGLSLLGEIRVRSHRPDMPAGSRGSRPRASDRDARARYPPPMAFLLAALAGFAFGAAYQSLGSLIALGPWAASVSGLSAGSCSRSRPAGQPRRPRRRCSSASPRCRRRCSATSS